jgi:hypothetical protein
VAQDRRVAVQALAEAVEKWNQLADIDSVASDDVSAVPAGLAGG